MGAEAGRKVERQVEELSRLKAEAGRMLDYLKQTAPVSRPGLQGGVGA